MAAMVRAEFSFPNAVNIEVAVTYLGDPLGGVATLAGDATYHDFYAENAPPLEGYAATAKGIYSGQPCALSIIEEEW